MKLLTNFALAVKSISRRVGDTAAELPLLKYPYDWLNCSVAQLNARHVAWSAGQPLWLAQRLIIPHDLQGYPLQGYPAASTY